jgi:hypothetical protein
LPHDHLITLGGHRVKTDLVLALVGGILAGAALACLRPTRAAGIVLFGLAVLCTAWFAVRDLTLRRDYECAAPGTLREAVVRRIGNPNKVTTHADFWGNHGSTVNSCANVDWYIATFTVDMYSFCYSPKQRLVSKYNWSSY